MTFNDQTGHFVGADLSCTSPIYRPMARRCPPQADKSAVRQYIMRLRDMTDLGVKILYRPMTRRCPPQADKSAVRQYIVRLRGMADVGW